MNIPKKGHLILLPSPISAQGDTHIPQFNRSKLDEISVLICERPKTCRHHIKRLYPDFDLSQIEYYQLNKKSSESEFNEILDLIDSGRTVGFMSEAGLPCVADPGQDLVNYCHQVGHQVTPLVGPSSLMLALMASGLNGQSFRFVGYVGIKKENLKRDLKFLERSAARNETQIFIETPYRNNQLLQSITQMIKPDLKLCVAVDLMEPTQFVKTGSIKQWQKFKSTINLHKRPAVFLLGR